MVVYLFVPADCCRSCNLGTGSPWSWLLPLLERLQLPVLDGRFTSCTALCVDPADLQQDGILKKLTLAHRAGNLAVRCTGCLVLTFAPLAAFD